MRFTGECFRAHDPAWAWAPLSGAGAALKGRRFNWPGLETLYLSLAPLTAIREVSAGFAYRLAPLLLCSYDVDCADIADLATEPARAALNIALPDLACPWAADLAAGREPASWPIIRRLRAEGHAGILVPSFAHGATPEDRNLVLWRWGPDLPHKVAVHDPTGRLPRNQLSWR